VRRLAPLLIAVLVVAFAGTASGARDANARRPVSQATPGGFDLAGGQLVRHGPPLSMLPVPSRSSGKIRVIVGLDGPPLAARASARQLFGFGPRSKLDVAASSSRSYLARLEQEQQLAIATLKHAIPEAVVTRRFKIVLNGITVTLPYSRLPRLMRLGFADRVYPSLRYTLNLNRSTSIVGAPQFSTATGARGDGVKVGVVDDGVDEQHPFFNPAGFSYPAGFPKGGSGATSPKIIAARGFAGPGGSGAPLNRDESFHGTFVSGIIGGVAGTDVPAGRVGFCGPSVGGCHPAIKGLSGVAPRVQIGNYRVFNVKLPLGGCCSGNTPEIIDAFEAAVADGMDVINFSGGGPQTDPRRDAMIEAIANTSRAGVVPVISAGNDRDFFGLGTVGSPGTAPDAISVGATTNSHVFGSALQVVSPSVPALSQVTFTTGSGGVPPTWESANQRLVDVGTITGTDRKPVSRRLCAVSGDPNNARSSTLPAGSLRGAIALVTRGECTYDSKATRAAAAGAVGTIFAEDRPGDPGFPLTSARGGMVSDLDGARLRQAMAGNGGAATIRIVRATQIVLEVPTSWPGVPTSFSAGGLTPFGHALKPDITAPGSQILSSTLIEYGGDEYVFGDGTSYSAPHVTGLAALLVQRHPTWTPKQVKSALMSTAGPAFADTGRTQEASVLVEGAGLAQVSAADHPLIFTDPQSLSFGYLSATAGATRAIQLAVSDAGDGAGTWQTEIQAQSASAGASIDAAPVTLGPGGTSLVQVVARASGGAQAGDNFGFLVLRRGGVTRRVPYAFSVTRSGLAGSPVTPLKTMQSGDTRSGEDRARVYRWPTAPFGIISLFGADTSVNDVGAEKVYSIDLPASVVNAGAVITQPPLDIRAPVQTLITSNGPAHPWFLGSLDENDVLGYAGIPTNANSLMPDFIFNVGAAGVVFPPAGRYYVVVDSGRDPFTNRSLAGRFTLRSWINDLKPPGVKVLTTRVSAGRPSIVARVRDAKSGVDPLSLLLLFGTVQVGATRYDPATGIAVFPIPREENPLRAGTEFMRVVASDFQEAKNIADTGDASPMPNTKFFGFRMAVVNGPSVNWITPSKSACLPARAKLVVAAGSTAQVSSVGFFDGNRQIARVRKNDAGIYTLNWSTKGRKKGAHVLRAVVSDTRGRETESSRPVKICR
jgi:minor extracellular serine protease Vpr